MMLMFFVQLGQAQSLQYEIRSLEDRMSILERDLEQKKQRMDKTKQEMGSSRYDSFYLHAKKNYDEAKQNIDQKNAELVQYKKQEITHLNHKIDATLASLASNGAQVANPLRPDNAMALERIEQSLAIKLTEVERNVQEAAQLAQLQQSIAEKNQKLESLGANPHGATSVKDIASAKSYNDKLESEVANVEAVQAEEERISEERSAMINKYLGMMSFLFVTFCVVYSVVKGLGRTAVVFADYTDLTLTFTSIIGLPFVIVMASAIATDDPGVVAILLVVVQFVIIQGISIRNLYYLNGRNTMTTFFVAVGRMVLCIGLLSTIVSLFKKSRNLYSQILTLIFGILLGKLILRIVARNEFTPLGQFLTKAKFVNEYDDQFLTEYPQIGTVN